MKDAIALLDPEGSADVPQYVEDVLAKAKKLLVPVKAFEAELEAAS